MIFRKNTWSFRSNLVLCLMCLAGAVWCVTELYPNFGVSMLMLGIFTCMVLLIVFNPWNQILQISENGIRCFRRDRTLWSLAWDEVESIRPVTVFGCRGYAIIPKDAAKRDIKTTRPMSEYTFEHTGKIRAALELYAPRLVEKRR